MPVDEADGTPRVASFPVYVDMDELVESFIRVRTGMAGMVDAVHQAATGLRGFRPEPEDPHRWTCPVRNAMRWTPPAADEEVPRWLA